MKSSRAILTAAVLLAANAAVAQQQQASATLDGKAISVNYSAPAAKNRMSASLHSDANLAFKGVNVPKGDYTLYVLADGAQWQLAVNKATGAKAATYDAKLDLGRVPLLMSKPAAAAGPCKITLNKTAALAAKFEVTWNNAVASTSFHLDRGGADSEW
jgi:hypothetical protein